LRHDAAARAASRSARSVARHGTGPVFHPAAGGAHSVTASVAAWMRWRGADMEACPGRGYEQDQAAVHRERNGGEPAALDARNHQSGEQSGRPLNGTKRTQIGKTSGSTDRSFGPDAVRYMSVTIATPCPTAAHDDTRRDKKETARRAAFPQRAGRFRRWWQVLGSNQRRLSRRFYSVPLLSPPHSR
jgi:hypothetical protein